MYKIAKPLFLMTETSLHAGSGDNLGVVDLPIQRERITGFPKIESSSVKGAFREALETKVKGSFKDINSDAAKIHRVFGFDDVGLADKAAEKDLRDLFVDQSGAPARDFAGSIGFTDARLLLFPVKSARGVFAWVTCPLVLQRFYDDLTHAGGEAEALSFLTQLSKHIEGLCLADTDLKVVSGDDSHTLLLEEYAFELRTEAKGGKAAPLHAFAEWLCEHVFTEAGFWQDKIRKDIVLLPDDDFADFVQLSTEVITRIKINNQTGTVQDGGLFTEEYLPAESLLYTIVLAAPELNVVAGRKETHGMQAEEVLSFFRDHLSDVVQLGGSASLGKGLLQTYKSLLNHD